MPLLQPDDVKFLTDSFAELTAPVTLTVVAKETSRLILPGADEDGEAEDTTADVKQIVGEVAATSPQVTVAERAPVEGELAPAIEFAAAHAKGKLRYVGLPAGYEMSTLVGVIIDLGAGEPPLPPPIAERLATLKKDVHIQVFVTPG
jgi:alkyl hydroperoxide reductase subunit AhpF